MLLYRNFYCCCLFFWMGGGGGGGKTTLFSEIKTEDRLAFFVSPINLAPVSEARC